jgi:SIT4-associating protein SAP185/190
MDLASAENTSGGYTFSGGTLLSGFTNSSDEEDEEMDEGDSERDRERERERVAPVSDTEQVGELSFEDVEMEYR